MKIYSGERRPHVQPSPLKTFDDESVVVTVADTGKGHGHPAPLAPRLDLRNHSPTGFEWGYGGSGPAQLSLALCVDVLQDAGEAVAVYQRVKEFLIAPIRQDRWTIYEPELRSAIQRANAERISAAAAERVRLQNARLTDDTQ